MIIRIKIELFPNIIRVTCLLAVALIFSGRLNRLGWCFQDAPTLHSAIRYNCLKILLVKSIFLDIFILWRAECAIVITVVTRDARVIGGDI